MGIGQSRKDLGRQIEAILLSKRTEEIAKYEPARTRKPRGRFRLHESLNSSAEICESPLFFREVGNRQQHGSVASRFRKCRSNHDHLRGAPELLGCDPVKIVVRNDEHVTITQL